MDQFGPISPVPASDWFVFDFTKEIADITVTLNSAQWSCTVDPQSPILDPTPDARILGAPVFSGAKTSALIGNMLDGCIYDLSVQVTTSDGRTLVDEASVQCTSIEAILEPEPTQIPFTITQYNALVSAYASGVLRVSVEGRETLYRSGDDLMRAILRMRAELIAAGLLPGPVPGTTSQIRFITVKGLW